MTTKDEFLPSSFVKNCSQDADNRIRYSNFSLNQNSKCPILIPVRIFSKSNNDKFGDSEISGNCEEKEKLQNFRKKHSTKNITLLLHISTYENSVKAESGSFGDGNDENHRLDKEKNAKQIFTASKFVVQNPFEFSRQQNDKMSKSELSQFKASQRLLNPNKAPKNDPATIPNIPKSSDTQNDASRPRNAVSPDSTTTTATSDNGESFVKEVQKMLLERATLENDIVSNLLEKFLASEPPSPELAAATQKYVESIFRKKDLEEKVAAKANKTKKND